MNVLTKFLVMMLAWAGAAPPQSTPPAALTANSSADEVLDALDQRGRNLQAFVADVRLVDEDTSLALSSTRAGKVWYQARPGDNARIRVTFDRRIDEEKNRTFKETVEYLLDGAWLVDRDYMKKIEVRRQVLKPGQKVNLLKLGEGPFPLPIGQPKEEVHRQFKVERIAPDKQNDPPNTVHLRLTPKEGGRFKKIKEMDLWVDLKTHFPAKIEVLDPNETTVRTTTLTNVTVNPQPPLTDRAFTLPPVPADWARHEEAFQE